MKQIIKVKGDLDDNEKEIVNKRLESYFPKIVNKTGAIKGLKIIINKYHKQGRATQYSIQTDLKVHSRQIETNAEKWDLKGAIHDALTKLLTRLEDEFHIKDRKKAVKHINPKFSKDAGQEINKYIEEVGDTTEEGFYIEWESK